MHESRPFTASTRSRTTAVRRDVRSGEASGEVRGTPTLFIDGVVHRGGFAASGFVGGAGEMSAVCTHLDVKRSEGRV